MFSRPIAFRLAITGFTDYSHSKNKPAPQPTNRFSFSIVGMINNLFSKPASLQNKSFKNINDEADKQKRIQEKLKINLMYAREALNHTNEVLPNGAANYHNSTQEISLNTLIKMNMMRDEQDWLIEHTWKTTPLHFHYNMDKIYLVMAQTATEYKVGNCGEHAAVAYVHLKYEKNLRKVVLACLKGGDHAFVIIGMDPNGDISNLKTWGKAAVVFDPWAKRYFPAEQLFDQLNQINKIFQETIYDPKLHSIGWTPDGIIPLEVTILNNLRLHRQQNKVEFAKRIIAATSGDSFIDEVIKLCLTDYLEIKAKPKIPPTLSESDRLIVEQEWLSYQSPTASADTQKGIW
jgi:hypothetical protein